ncbi:Tetratricopeptide-like helical domain superfamily [Sesbania bispinosa]|nr:Tetratricopeptide-like helical domain superfamily [Sesbania bispinosa]
MIYDFGAKKWRKIWIDETEGPHCCVKKLSATSFSVLLTTESTSSAATESVLAPSPADAIIKPSASTGIVEEKQIEEGERASTGGSFLIPFFLPKIREVSTTILEWKSSPDPFNFGSFSSINLSKLPLSAYSESKHVESDENIEDVVDEQEKVDDTEEDTIIESDVELEGKIVEPDDDPLQKMGDPSVEVTDENCESSQSAKANAMEAISEGKFEEAKSPKDRTILAQDAIGVVITAAAEDMEHACIMFDEMHKRSSPVSVTLISREGMLPLFSRAVKFGYITYNLYNHSFLHLGLNTAMDDSLLRKVTHDSSIAAAIFVPFYVGFGIASDETPARHNLFYRGLIYKCNLVGNPSAIATLDAFRVVHVVGLNRTITGNHVFGS